MTEAVPAWCDTPEMRAYWRRPWTVPLSGLKARRFKRRCWEHGYLSPHITRAECASRGTPVPRILRRPCQRLCFHMERVRHRMGDRPLAPLNVYRTRSHNADVGGVTLSRHLIAGAWDPSTPLDPDICEAVFRKGAIGYQSPSDNTVRHVDARRGPVRYFYS